MKSVSSTTPFSIRLLHLEDSLNDAELIHSVLAKEWPDFEVLRVETSEDFTSALRGQPFDLILSDFSLPRFNGLAALKLARELSPATPFVFLSGTIGEENAVEALKMGATDYVIKDRAARLVPAIRRALTEAREHRRRQQAEVLLRESQERFQQLADQSSELFWFVAVNPEKVLFISPAIQQIWGFPSADYHVEPRARLAAIHPADRAQVWRAYDDCICGRVLRFEQEYRVMRPDGTLRWVLDSATVIRDATGAPVQLSGIAKDITARKTDEGRLREQAELLDKARDAIVVTDMERRIVFWNRGAEKVFGWPAAEALGQSVAQLFGADMAEKIEALQAAKASDEWHSEIELQDRHGEPRVLLSSVTLIREPDDRPKARLIISTDITEQKKMENQFLRAQRLESLGLLAAGIAHDLNNVLTPVLMGAPLLRQQITDSTNLRILEGIENSAERGAGLVRQILSFAHGASGAKQLVHIKHVLHDVTELIQQTFPRSIRLEERIPDDLWPVQANPTQLHQIILNLCVNARDAMPHGGVLRIRAENRVLNASEALTPPETRLGPHLLLEVTDSGTGIPPEVLTGIWEPFFSTKAARAGTGLGLATVRGIAANHGGFVTVQSEVGRGTVFQVFLPALEPTATAENVAATAPPFLSRGKGELVLVVDDEISVRELIKAVLTRHGYRVLGAANGVEALALFKPRATEFAVVVTDINMPEMDGVSLARALPAHNPAVKVIFTSGAGSGSIPPEFATIAGAVHKPFTADALLNLVRKTIDAPAKKA